MKETSLLSLLNLALKHITVIIFSAIVFAAAAFAYCKYISVPLYSATGSVLVTNGAIKESDIENGTVNTKLDNTDIVASINFMPTAEEMFKQNKIFKLLANKLDNKYTYTELIGMSEINRKTDRSLYIDVTFTSQSEHEAVTLVNNYMELVPDYIKEEVAGISIQYDRVDKARRLSARTLTVTFLAAVSGAAAAYLIFLAFFLTNSTIADEDEFKEHFNLPVIGSIPDFSSAKAKKSYKYGNKYYSYYGRGNKKYEN